MNNRETLYTNQEVFLNLLRVGLWENRSEFQVSQDSQARMSDQRSSASFGFQDSVDWSEVYRLASEQCVVGVVLAGIEHSYVKPPQEKLLQWIGEVQILEQQNQAMNQFIAKLIEKLRSSDIYALLLKGQGVAQCYERPLWRASGDVDLFLSDANYTKAEKLLSPLASSIDDEISYAKHKALTIDEWTVELHGSLRSGLWRSLDRVLDKVQYDVFCGGNVRSWLNGKTQVFMPRADEDVVYVFSHILQHFYKEGIGLRQICDWCRMLWKFKDKLDYELLESRIRKAGVMTEWKAFAALAVDYLGMPSEAMPFYSDDKKWKRKAVRAMEFVLETGNFGHNRDYSYQKKYPYIICKAISFWKHLKDGAFFFSIFPLDSIKVTWRRMVVGVSVVLQGKKHE